MTGVQDELVRADTSFEGTLPYAASTDPQLSIAADSKPATKAAARKGELPKSKIDPEPRPIRHLRNYSNYMSPRLGITSADTWTIAAVYVRNLLLNLLILVPILALLLAAPRLFALMLRYEWASPTRPLCWMELFLGIAFAYVGLARPVAPGRNDQRIRGHRALLYNVFTILPLTAAAMFLATYWAQHAATSGLLDGEALVPIAPFVLVGATTGLHLLGSVLLVTLLPCVVYYVRYLTTSAASRKAGLSRQGGKHFAWKVAFEVVGAVVGMATALALTFLAAIKLFPDPLHPVNDPSKIPAFLRPLTDAVGQGHLYLCFAVPLVLLIFFVQASIFVGLSSRRNEDDDREWWGRAGAYLLFFAAVIALLGVITVFGPLFLYRAPVILASVGGLSGLAAALFGFSAKTPANGKEKEDAGTSGKLMNAAAGLIVPIFACILLAAISLGHTWLAEQFNGFKVNDTNVSFATQFQAQANAAGIIAVDRDRATGALREATSPVVPPGHDRTSYLVKRESAKVADDSFVSARGVAHLQTIAGTGGMEAIIIVLVAAFSIGLSFFIGVNKFSMHSLYRNRLIRAYLGASRYNRDPDAFTGFDPHDNLQMHELRQELLWPTCFKNVTAFVKQLTDHNDAVSLEIWNSLDKKTRQQLEDRKPDDPIDAPLTNALVRNLNGILQNGNLGSVRDDDSPAARLRYNRETLDQTFSDSISPLKHRGPMHVINTALNLTSGEKLAWQQRQAESFTVTPLHSGSFYVGYRDSKEYGGEDGISVGTAVTISGAAASPNQGYNSSPALAFLLTLLNVRLGSWLGNPGLAGRNTYDSGHPRTNLEPLLWELTGTTNDQCPLVYLSDGGHFENLGVYEMVLRRCRYIVVSDGGCDPKYSFEDLGNAIRKIRTDMGVPIDIEKMYMFPRSADGKYVEGRYVATARIRYSAIDATPDGVKNIDGTLIYIKPGLYSEDYFPKDVYNYATSSAEFPHESTADQFFSESQFESYRALGRHVINEICGNYVSKDDLFPVARSFDTVAQFAEAVRTKADRDKSFDFDISKAKDAGVNLAVLATPSARLVIR